MKVHSLSDLRAVAEARLAKAESAVSAAKIFVQKLVTIGDGDEAAEFLNELRKVSFAVGDGMKRGGANGAAMLPRPDKKSRAKDLVDYCLTRSAHAIAPSTILDVAKEVGAKKVRIQGIMRCLHNGVDAKRYFKVGDMFAMKGAGDAKLRRVSNAIHKARGGKVKRGRKPKQAVEPVLPKGQGKGRVKDKDKIILGQWSTLGQSLDLRLALHWNDAVGKILEIAKEPPSNPQLFAALKASNFSGKVPDLGALTVMMRNNEVRTKDNSSGKVAYLFKSTTGPNGRQKLWHIRKKLTAKQPALPEVEDEVAEG